MDTNKIRNIAAFLGDENNEFFKEASDEHLDKIAHALFEASAILNKIADEVDPIPAEEDLGFSEKTIEEIGAIAEAFDKSGDEELQKQASVLDELLVTIAAPRGYVADWRAWEDAKVEELKKKYKDLKEESDKINNRAEAVAALEKSEIFKAHKPNIALLSSRACPEHGMPMYRVGPTSEGSIWQCSLDHKIFNYEEGFTLADGSKHPGTLVANQAPDIENQTYQIFDNREDRLMNSRQ